jgi:hypothetical protein
MTKRRGTAIPDQEKGWGREKRRGKGTRERGNEKWVKK